MPEPGMAHELRDAADHLQWAVVEAEVASRLASPLARGLAAAGSLPVAPRGLGWAAATQALAVLDGLELAAAFASPTHGDGHAAAPDRPSERDALGSALGAVRDAAAVVELAARGSVLDPLQLLTVGELVDAIAAACAVVTTARDAMEPRLRVALRVIAARTPTAPAGAGSATSSSTEGPAATAGVVDAALCAPLALAREVVPDPRAPRERRELGLATLAALEGLLQPLPLLHEALARSIEPDPDAGARVADAASPALARARAEAAQARRRLVSEAEALVRGATLGDTLADRYWTEREGRVVVPVRADRFSRVGHEGATTGVVHDASGRGGTLFVEPFELLGPNNALRRAQWQAQDEERRVLEQLSAEVAAHARALLQGQLALLQLDVWRARLRACRAIDGRAPTLVPAAPGERVWLPRARHPIMAWRGAEVVPSDLQLDVGTATLISGPNAGGKTVALKTVGLCVFMARAGLRIPCGEGATVPLFDGVESDVGDDQSIAANLSTFTAHLAHVGRALGHGERGARALVLLDEIAAGTDPEQGAALAESIVRALVAQGATVMATTHAARLKLLASQEPAQFRNASVGFDLARLRPTFELRFGVPGSSSAFAVARRVGLPEPIVHAAEALVTDESLKVDVLLQQVEAEREQLARLRAAAADELAALQAERAALREREAKAIEAATVAKTRAFDAAAARLRELGRVLDAQRRAVRRATARGDLQALAVAAKGAREELDAHRVPEPAPPGAPPSELRAGDRVHVPRLSSDGEVVSVKGEKVTVLVGSVKLTARREELRPATTRAAKRPQAARTPPPARDGGSAARYFGGDPDDVEPRHDNVVDVRGARPEEAVAAVENFLSRALADDVEAVIVRHGHGTGALRKAIREALRRVGHVRSVRGGTSREGGDGVTVVWVRGP